MMLVLVFYLCPSSVRVFIADYYLTSRNYEAVSMETSSISYYGYSKSQLINFGNSLLVVAALQEVSENILKCVEFGF